MQLLIQRQGTFTGLWMKDRGMIPCGPVQLIRRVPRIRMELLATMEFNLRMISMIGTRGMKRMEDIVLQGQECLSGEWITVCC